MDVGVSLVFVAAMATAVATGLGALPFLFVREIGRRWRGVANATAAGLMLGASHNLIAEGARLDQPGVLLGILAGLLAIVAANRLIRRHGAMDIADLHGAGARRALLILGVASLVSKLAPSLLLLLLGLPLRAVAAGSFLLATPLTLLVAIAALGQEMEILDATTGAAVIILAISTGVVFPTLFKLMAPRESVTPPVAPTRPPNPEGGGIFPERRAGPSSTEKAASPARPSTPPPNRKG